MGAGWDAVEMVEDRKGHDRRYSVDDSRLRALGYAPRHNLEQGLYETIQWYRDNEAWWRPLKGRRLSSQMSRWLITGSEGQLGTALAALLNGDDVVALDRKDLDITDGTSVLDVIRSVRPTVVINAAAYTAVVSCRKR